MSIQDIKDLLELFQTLITTLAVIVGGFWAGAIFMVERRSFVAAELEMDLFVKHLEGENSESMIFIHVTVYVRNVGSKLIRLTEAKARIQWLFPFYLESNYLYEAIDEHFPEVQWPIIDSHVNDFKEKQKIIEPKEREESNFSKSAGSP